VCRVHGEHTPRPAGQPRSRGWEFGHLIGLGADQPLPITPTHHGGRGQQVGNSPSHRSAPRRFTVYRDRPVQHRAAIGRRHIRSGLPASRPTPSACLSAQPAKTRSRVRCGGVQPVLAASALSAGVLTAGVPSVIRQGYLSPSTPPANPERPASPDPPLLYADHHAVSTPTDPSPALTGACSITSSEQEPLSLRLRLEKGRTL